MYAFSPTAERTREIWLNTVSKLSGLLPPGSVQEGSIMAFTPLDNVSRNATVKLNSSDDTAVTPVQKLLPNMRLAELFAIGIGVCKVPVLNGKELWGHAEYTSDPSSAIFSATEQVALRHLFGSVIAFDTNGTKRFDAMHASDFNIVTVEAAANTIKPRMLTASYTMVGGENNKIEIAMPDTGDLAPLANSAARNLYICVKASVIYIVPASNSGRDEIALRMRGGK
jgi:hypothetical protein